MNRMKLSNPPNFHCTSNNTRKAIAGAFAVSLLIAPLGAIAADSKKIVHDAEYYILEAQNGKVWEVENGELDKKLAALKKKIRNSPQHHPLYVG